jgi:deferrochelatase/peroxidase EfeB
MTGHKPLGRRGFLGGLIGAGVAGPLAAGVAASDAASASDSAQPASYPFHGAHQQGILTPVQRNASVVAFDVTAANRDEVQALLRTITERARFLTAGGSPAEVGITAPPADSGLLGPRVPADGLTVTASVGASLFDDRFGLASAKPARLRRMDDFPNDALDRAQCDGDLLLQLCAHNTDAVLHALRDITRATRGAMQVRWRKDGFVSPPRPSGTPRNLLGFKDGTSSPATASAKAADALVWTQAGANGPGANGTGGNGAGANGPGGNAARGDEPEWVTGGSYHVVRIIRMFVEFWDRVSLHEQENMIGRRRDSGAPQTATNEFDDPHYENDPTGDVIQMDAHIRLANPRTAESKNQQMLRRGYNYDAGVDANGNLDMGLIFSCFNQDLDRQFVAVQKRLADEPLVDYISPVGGGYFFALPGVRSSSDWLGRGLLS